MSRLARFAPLFALVLTGLLLPANAHAKDLRNRFGVGFNSWFGHVDALSLRWGLPTGDPAVNIQIEGDLGFASNPDIAESTGIFAGGRLLYGVVVEDNMNLYLSGGAGYIDASDVGVVRIQPGATVDFFLFGLENLGFSAGFGVNLDLGTGSGISTTGAVLGGLHYWF